MKSLLFVTSVLCTLVSVPLAAQQTLAGASEAAKKVVHEWPLSAGQVPVFDADKAAASLASIAVVPVGDTPAVASTPVMSAVKDEAYWKGRSRAVTTTLKTDQTFLTAAIAVERALNTQLHQSRDNTLYIRDRIQRGVVENQWQDSVKDVSRLTALVATDKQAKRDLELEAHRAGVPPGWLVLE